MPGFGGRKFHERLFDCGDKQFFRSGMSKMSKQKAIAAVTEMPAWKGPYRRRV